MSFLVPAYVSFPLASRVRVRDTWGDPRTGHTHRGIDLVAPEGTPVLSVGAGRVVGGAWGAPVAREGYYVVIEDADGWQHLYAHLREAPSVERGARVQAGELIGYVGHTGNARGAHLHYGVRRGDNYFNPYQELRAMADNPLMNLRNLPPGPWTRDQVKAVARALAAAATAFAWPPNVLSESPELRDRLRSAREVAQSRASAALARAKVAMDSGDIPASEREARVAVAEWRAFEAAVEARVQYANEGTLARVARYATNDAGRIASGVQDSMRELALAALGFGALYMMMRGRR